MYILENTQTLVVASKEIGLEVSVGKSKYMVIAGDQNVGGNQIMKFHSSTFERVKQIPYLRNLTTNQNSILEDNENILKSRNASFLSVKNIQSCSLLCKTTNINIHRNIILLVVVHECKTWSMILREQRRLRLFERRVLTRIFRPT